MGIQRSNVLVFFPKNLLLVELTRRLYNQPFICVIEDEIIIGVTVRVGVLEPLVFFVFFILLQGKGLL